MKTNISNSESTNYILSQEDHKEIEDNAKELLEFVEAHLMLYDDLAQLRWSVGSEDFMTLCRYQAFLSYNFAKTFDDTFHIEQKMDGNSDNALLSIVIERFPVCLDEIKKVSTYIFETAKSRGCDFVGVWIDIVSDDDPRCSYEFKSR